MVQTALGHLIVHAVLSTRVAHAWPPSLTQAPNRAASGVLVVPRVGIVLNRLKTAIRYIPVMTSFSLSNDPLMFVTRTSAKQRLAWLALVSILNVYGLHS